METAVMKICQKGECRPSKALLEEEVRVVPQRFPTLGDFWDGIPRERLNKGFMAYVGARPASVEYIAFFSSGQQGLGDYRDTHPSIVSGSTGAYRQSDEFALDEKSLSGQFFKCTDEDFCFNREKTLQVSIFDNLFDFQESENMRKTLLKGFKDFLLDSVRDQKEQLKAVYLAGGSRGGCLVAKLAKSLMAREDLKHVKFIVQSFDGVCRTDNEFGTKVSKPFRNPLKWQWYAYRTDVTKQFKREHKTRLCMRHLTGGEKVITELARSFTHKSQSCKKKNCAVKLKNGHKYYEQTWTKLGHMELLSDHAHDDEVVKPMMEHFKKCKERLAIL
jgi:hypothetical protein